jgi:hypothetical protein
VKEFTGMCRLKPDADLEAFTSVLAPGVWPVPVETSLTKKELENPAIRELFMSVLVVDAGSLTRGYPPLLSPLTPGRVR